jgi:hypothetical protein
VTHFRAWLRWFWAGPGGDAAYHLQVANAFADVGRSLHGIDQRLLRLEQAQGSIASIVAEVAGVRAAQRQLQDLQHQLDKPGVIRPRTASQFRQAVEEGLDNAA